MKKTLFTLLLIFSTISIHAKVKYQGEVDLGYSVGVRKFYTGSLNIHTIQGLKVSDYFSAGLGLGLDYYHASDEFIVPIYLNMKTYFPVSETLAPFVSMDLGYGLDVTELLSGTGGLYISPTLGLRYKRLKFQIGYTSQRISADYGGILFKVGVVF